MLLIERGFIKSSSYRALNICHVHTTDIQGLISCRNYVYSVYHVIPHVIGCLIPATYP